MTITAEEVLAEIGPVQEILDEHDGVVTVLDTSDGNIMLSLDGGCNGCSSTPMTAMQIYYSLKKLDAINDVIFVNGELQITCAPSSIKKWQRNRWQETPPAKKMARSRKARLSDHSS
jgi:Fe-S cluster biogenesis protein NfuA